MVVNATLHFVWLQLSPWEPGPLKSPSDALRSVRSSRRVGLVDMSGCWRLWSWRNVTKIGLFLSIHIPIGSMYEQYIRYDYYCYYWISLLLMIQSQNILYSIDLLLWYPIGSMVLLYMVTWIPSIYPLYVSIYTSTMDPMG